MLKELIEEHIGDIMGEVDCDRAGERDSGCLNGLSCLECEASDMTAKIITAVRECKEPISKAIYTGQQNPNIMAHIHNAAIDKVLAKLEGK